MEQTELHRDLNEILAMLREKLGISNAILRRLEDGELITVAYFGYGKEEAMIRIKVGYGVTGLCARDRHPVVIQDLTKWKGEYIAGIAGAQSELCLPLIQGSTLIGTFNIESTVKENFTLERIALISRMSEMLTPSVADLSNRTGRLLASAFARLEKMKA